MLNLWFKHGGIEKVNNIILQGFEKIEIKVWTDVIPQLLARVDNKNSRIKNSMMELMRRICEALPQTMIYPVSVLSKSLGSARREIAQQLIDTMTRTHPVTINQALQVSDELIRSAVLLTERWREAIEECS